MKAVVSDVVSEFKKFFETKKLIIGTDETLKSLRSGRLVKVFIASNCDVSLKSDLLQLCKIGNVELVDLKMSSDEVGVICKKPFSVSVVGAVV